MKRPAKMPAQDPITKRFLKATPVIPTVSDGVLNQSTDVPSPSVDASLEVSPPSLENTIPEARAAASQTPVLAKSARVQDGLDPLTIELTDGLPVAPVAPVAPNIEAPVVAPTVTAKKSNGGLLVGLGVLIAGAAVVGIVVLSGGRAGALAPRLPVGGIE